MTPRVIKVASLEAGLYDYDPFYLCFPFWNPWSGHFDCLSGQ